MTYIYHIHEIVSNHLSDHYNLLRCHFFHVVIAVTCENHVNVNRILHVLFIVQGAVGNVGVSRHGGGVAAVIT